MRFTLDSNVVIYEIDGKLASPLPAGSIYVSIISKIELLSFPGSTPEQEVVLKGLIDSVTLVGVTPQVVSESIRLRKQYRLRLPDSIIAATSIVTASELLTHDIALLKIPGLKASAPPLKP